MKMALARSIVGFNFFRGSYVTEDELRCETLLSCFTESVRSIRAAHAMTFRFLVVQY